MAGNLQVGTGQLASEGMPLSDNAVKESAASALLGAGPHVHIHGEEALRHVLEQLEEHHTHLTVLSASLSPDSVSLLSGFLGNKNNTVTDLSLSGVPLGDAGTTQLLASLAKPREKPSPLRRLDLSHVGLKAEGMKALAFVLKSSDLGSLRHINVSNNFGNWPGVKAVQSALKARTHAGLPPVQVDLDGNLFVIEMLNAVTHGVGAGGAVAGGVLMTIRSLQRGLPLATIASLAVFVTSLFTLMMSSCVYHSCFRHPHASRQLRKADHCSIFVLIAGSYTPFVVCYTLDPPTVAGPLTLLVVWLCATVGVVMSLGSYGSSNTRSLFALGMGWVGAFSVRTMVERMQSEALSFVVIGGVIYSLGIIFYLLGKKIPMMHVVWHIAVMLGGGFHFFALWEYVVNAKG